MKRNLLRWVARSIKQISKIIHQEKVKRIFRFTQARKLVLTGLLPLVLVGQIKTLPAQPAVTGPIVTSMTTKLEDGFFNEKKAQVQIVVGESEASRQVREENERASNAIRQVVTRDSTPARSEDASVEAKHQLAQSIAAQYGIDWKLLVAVWQVESGKSMGATRYSSAGAMGPMQFMPGTWRSMGVDGNGDGVTDVNNVYDALHGGARYLASNGASNGDIDNALIHYNHSWSYVNKVKGIMNSI
jgi:membrane-bound lytic murein transglycosylase B